MRKLLAVAVLAVCAAPLHAAEGMWTLDNLPRADFEARYGFKPAPAFVYKLMRASVRLASGCSGSFVSADGLVLTNGHCAVECVQSLSSAERDLVNNGFVAPSRSAELQCPTYELNRLEETRDVTAEVAAATAGVSGKAFSEARTAIESKLESACVGDDAKNRRCDLVELYHGGQYQLYRYRRFQDVRLVFSPEYSVWAFGGDPDNFNFPRYNLDMALLRAYVDGKPAQVDDYFPVSRSGARAGDMTLVTGHPGSTERLYTVAQLERLRDFDLISTLLYLAERRGMLGQYSRADAEQARVARTDLTSVENAFKVYQGQLQALLDPAVIARKRTEEDALRATVDAQYADAWDLIAQAQQTWRRIARVYLLIERGRGFSSAHFGIARHLVRAAEERAKPDGERLKEYQDANLPRLQQSLFAKTPIYPDYEKAKLTWSLTKLREQMGTDDPLVRLVLGKESPEALAARLVDGTELSGVETRRRLWDGGPEAIMKSADPFIQLARAVDGAARAVRRQYEEEVEAVEEKNAERIAQARFRQLGTAVYPDATFTLRLSYGEVKGWEEDGRGIEPFTTLQGLFARTTGAAPYALPERWHKARARLDLKTPFNFVTSNDITGGNSGSPAINAKGEIVGLAFDGNIHSLGGAYVYDERLNRTVAVDSRGILEALAKVYAAPHLVKEMTQR